MSNARELAELGGSYGTGGSSGLKNRIINGAMVIDQRNAGASVSTQIGYLVDRFFTYQSQSGKFTFQQNAGSVTPPAGFINYAGFTSSSAYSVGSGDVFDFGQVIEGLNVADLGWGTANAQAVTLSFWVRSSLTGTFGGVVMNSAQNTTYPFSYTISSANTWTKIVLNVSGPTTGTWLTTNGNGMQISFSLGAGSTYLGTANAWGTANVRGVTGQVNVVGTSGATWYMTGMQFEKGSTATSFDYRPYGTELALCQRYYYKTFLQATAPAQNIAANNQLLVCGTSNTINGTIFPVAMRTNPTITTYNPFAANSSFRIPSSSTDVAVTGTSTADWGITSFGCSATAPFAVHCHFTGSAEL
jgi:hypothetical protein